MARAPNKTAEAVQKAAQHGASSLPETAEAPRHVVLLGIASRAGGRLLPVGKPLLVGTDIPADLAQARLDARTAELVLGSTITARALREVVQAAAAKVRNLIDAFLAEVEAAGSADLPELIEGFRPDRGLEEEGAHLREALAAHVLALRAEAEQGAEGGSEAEKGGAPAPEVSSDVPPA